MERTEFVKAKHTSLVYTMTITMMNLVTRFRFTSRGLRVLVVRLVHQYGMVENDTSLV